MWELSEKYHGWLLAGCCLALTVLWLPGLRFPIVSDTALYAEIGENLWRHARYAAITLPEVKHLPLHALVSYPFTILFGLHLGMKLSTLLAGFGVLIGTYFLLRRTLGATVALCTVVLLTFHHAFVLMTMLGSADLLFTALFIGSLAAYASAESSRRYYLLAGILAGLACVTRYNGLPLLPFLLLYTVLARRRDLASPWLWAGAVASVLPLSLWLLHSAVVFGNPFHTSYTAELASHSIGPVAQLLSNIIFYLNPLHNILPVLAVTSLYGIFRHARAQPFPFWAMLIAWPLTAIWWVQAMRFAFPGYPILLGFGVIGFIDLCRRVAGVSPGRRSAVTFVAIALLLFTHLPFLCFYGYGACNAWFDRRLSFLPPNLGLTTEGFYAWSLMRDRLNDIAPRSSAVFVDTLTNERAWRRGVFRSDIGVTLALNPVCPVYHISQTPGSDETVVAQTNVAPITFLTTMPCSGTGE